ncbi:hypothetical protein ABPG77_011257 [Micractinium sp. CCAP 211/92]
MGVKTSRPAFGGLSSPPCRDWEPLRRTFGSRRSRGLLTALLPVPLGPLRAPVPRATSQQGQQQACSTSAVQSEQVLLQTHKEMAARSAAAAAARQQVAHAREAALRQELARREAVIQHLSRQRDDAAVEALYSWRQLWEQAVRRNARSTAALAAVRVRYDEMVESLRDTMFQLESDMEQAPCSCCGGSVAAASALTIFAAAGRVAEVRGDALHWQEQAQDAWLELQACKAHVQQLQMDARTAVTHLESSCQQADAAAKAQEERAAAAEAALERERAKHEATRRQLRQQRSAAHRLDSCRSFGQRLQLKSAAACEVATAGGNIPAFWVELS